MSLGIRVQLFWGFGFVLVLLLAIGFIGLKNTTQFAAESKSLYDNRVVSVVRLSAVDQAVYELRLGAAGATYPGTTLERRAAIKAQDAVWLQKVDDNMNAFEAGTKAAEENAVIQDWDLVYPAFLKSRQHIVDLVDQGNVTEAAGVRTAEFTGLTQQSAEVLNRLLSLQDSIGSQTNTETAALADLSVQILVLAILAALAVGGGVAFYIPRKLARGVTDVRVMLTSLSENCAASLEHGLAAMSDSDLGVELHSTTRPIARYGKDEVGQTAHVANVLLVKLQGTIASYERARTGLGALVGQVRFAANGLADSSNQLGMSTNQAGLAVQQVTMAMQNVATGAQDTSRGAQDTNAAVGQLAQAIHGIAQGASEQARQVQSANDSATQMASGVDQVATSAEQVASASDETRKAAQHGGLAVRETTAAMAEIQRVVGQAAGTVEDLGKLGDKIGAVVETIDDIAEQTNLLALNAAIEAARAGEHGRGFAVVADEVRKLAERSSRETKQIADLIQQVQVGTKHAVKAMQAGATKIEQGSQKAELAGEALDAILAAVEHTVTQAGEIARASHEMALGSRRVTEAMTSISAIVEQNTAATEQMSAQSGQVAQAIQSIAAVSEEQSASTEEVSASAEEMSAQIEEMSAQAQGLSSTAEELRELVARFHLDVSPAASDTQDVPRRITDTVTGGVTGAVRSGVTGGVRGKVQPLDLAA
jgi:methyl-accepting chemotaxis protein